MTPIEAYIRQAARARGIDPDVAVRVARSEGGLINPVQQSNVVKNGIREQSYGPFQLQIVNGLGARALAAGIDPRDPKQWQRGVDFALNEASQKGWGQWYGAAKAGLGDKAGISGAAPVFGSMSPPTNIDPNGANSAFGNGGNSAGGRLQAAGKGFDAAVSEMEAPTITPMPTIPSGGIGALAQLLSNPQALAQLLMKQRFG